MKTSAFSVAAVLAVGTAIFSAGCAQPTIAASHLSTVARPSGSFALAVTLPDGSQPTPEQWATIKAAFEQQLAAAGYALVDNISLADQIIRVVFTPTPGDPANGISTVVSVRANPAYAFNNATVYPSYGYSTLGSSYNSALLGYDYYDSYYNTSRPVVIVPRGNEPHHHRPNQPDDCQPGTQKPGDQYAHRGDGSHYRSPGPGPSGSGAGRWAPNATRLDSGAGSSYSRSDSSRSRSESSRSRSDSSSSYVGPSSSYSSSSNSLPSASFSSGSSSSSYSAPSSSSSSFSSGSSSSSSPVSSGAGDTGSTNRNAN